MRRPWLPRLRCGQATNSIPPGDFGDDTEGWYLQLAWLGMLVAVEVGSVSRHERMMERWAAGAEKCTCQAHPTHCANDCPLHGLEEEYLPVADMIGAAWGFVHGEPEGRA